MQSYLWVKVSTMILPTTESDTCLFKEFLPKDASETEFLDSESGKGFFPYPEWSLLFYCRIIWQLIPNHLNSFCLLIIRLNLLHKCIPPMSVKPRYGSQTVSLFGNLYFLWNNFSWFKCSAEPMSQGNL